MLSSHDNIMKRHTTRHDTKRENTQGEEEEEEDGGGERGGGGGGPDAEARHIGTSTTHPHTQTLLLLHWFDNFQWMELEGMQPCCCCC